MGLLVILVVPFYLLLTMHLRARHLPLISWGGTLAVVIFPIAFLLGWGVAIILCGVDHLCIELVYALAAPEQEAALASKAEAEVQHAAQRQQQSQEFYDSLDVLAIYSNDQQFEFQNALRRLQDLGVPHHVRSGPICTILVRPEDLEAGAVALGL